jgi:hypothetical protein
MGIFLHTIYNYKKLPNKGDYLYLYLNIHNINNCYLINDFRIKFSHSTIIIIFNIFKFKFYEKCYFKYYYSIFNISLIIEAL